MHALYLGSAELSAVMLSQPLVELLQKECRARVKRELVPGTLDVFMDEACVEHLTGQGKVSTGHPRSCAVPAERVLAVGRGGEVARGGLPAPHPVRC